MYVHPHYKMTRTAFQTGFAAAVAGGRTVNLNAQEVAGRLRVGCDEPCGPSLGATLPMVDSDGHVV